MAITESHHPAPVPGECLTPTWKQPSHPETIKINSSAALASSSDPNNSKPSSFTLTAVAAKNIPANTLLAKNTSTTLATAKDYSTVQISRNEHIRLNSDLLYCNHSCDPNVRFVTSTLQSPAGGVVVVEEGPVSGAIEVWSERDIPAGEELRFFYPSTEWEMAQPFECSCGAEKCLGSVDGAKNLSTDVLKGYWLSGHIESLLAEKEGRN
ncbi:hypothetical protein AJ80_01512 [Polytolypa hystricis UAMH7299]|uniref:Post-SET domain-containing protein n=1 Tax=Polytolypa hystricis (strain UAMH7299) TaxID=1447883 RepID=A0A2B7Z0U1_POLH7|nr:hypothetical protein AJ80_01512 [Polytolypa hystricis UAMH7299]